MAKAEGVAQSGGLQEAAVRRLQVHVWLCVEAKGRNGKRASADRVSRKISTVDERREEMIAVARERAARILIKKAKAQRDRRTQLIEVTASVSL